MSGKPFFSLRAPVALALAMLATACGGGAATLTLEDGASAPLSRYDSRYDLGDSHIVVFQDWVADPAEAAASLLSVVGVAPTFVYSHALKGFAAPIPLSFLPAIAGDPRVAWVERDSLLHVFAQATPPGMDRINVDQNPIANIDNIDDPMDVDVAVLDTGVDLDHPDLRLVVEPVPGVWTKSRSFIGSEPTPDDGHGHGTHVAGTVAAIDNTIGVVGVAPGARIWAIKVLSSTGSGSTSGVVAGIDHVAANAAEIEVANMSLGGGGCAGAGAMRAAIQGATAAGVVFVVAAGNSARDVYGGDGLLCGLESGLADDYVPAGIPEAMTVSAMADSDGIPGGLGAGTWAGPDDTFASFTNFATRVWPGNPVVSTGGAIDLAGPGVNILSTSPGGTYRNLSGTSMASPHLAGSAALYVLANGRAFDATGVAAIRQGMIDAAEDQPWRPAGSNDPDISPERLVDVASFAGAPPPPPGSGPVVTILSPLDLSTSDLGDPVTFTATAIDGQDGDLSASLAWVSSLDGPFGSGASFAYALSEGYHEITASVTDSSGLTGSATVRHTVLPPAPPISTIFVELSTDQPLYFDGQTVIVTVTATAGGAGGGGLQPVPGGTVRFAIVTPNQTVMQDWGVTDANGIYTYTYVVDTTAHGVGVYQMGAQVEHPAFGSGQNSGYYQVQ